MSIVNWNVNGSRLKSVLSHLVSASDDDVQEIKQKYDNIQLSLTSILDEDDISAPRIFSSRSPNQNVFLHCLLQ